MSLHVQTHTTILFHFHSTHIVLESQPQCSVLCLLVEHLQTLYVLQRYIVLHNRTSFGRNPNSSKPFDLNGIPKQRCVAVIGTSFITVKGSDLPKECPEMKVLPYCCNCTTIYFSASAVHLSFSLKMPLRNLQT